MIIEDCRWTQLPNDFIDQGGIIQYGAKAACIYWCIARKTKGWQKTEDAISLSQLTGMTGFARTTVCQALEILFKAGIVQGMKHKGKTTVYALRLAASSATLLDQSSSATSTSSVALPTKETLTKETIQKIHCGSEEPPEVERSSKSSKKKEKSDEEKEICRDAKALLQYYFKKHSSPPPEGRGFEPTMVWPRDTKLMKIVLGNYTLAAAQLVMDAFFAWPTRRDFTIRAFYNKFDTIFGALKDEAEGRRR